MRLQDVGFSTVTANTTVVTTAETVAASVSGIREVLSDCRVVVLGFFEMTTGANTTDLKIGVRRGTAGTGTLIGEANAVTIYAATGSTEQRFIMASESRTNEDSLAYCITVIASGASANGTILQAGILVLVF